VETPRWVAGDSASLDLLHAAVYEQCRVTGGYPYVLARAHELAVIGGQEREEFEAMITAAMLRNNITPAPSEKARLKQLMTGSRRRPRR
jgi:NurA-like 5'-3' nuclease